MGYLLFIFFTIFIIIICFFVFKSFKYNSQLNKLKEDIKKQEEIYNFYVKKNQFQESEYQSTQIKISEMKEFGKKIEEQIKSSKEDLERTDENLLHSIDEYNEILDKIKQSRDEYSTIRERFSESFEQEKKEKTEELNKLKSTISAAIEVIRKQEINDNERRGFMLQVSENDIDDVKKLLDLSFQFHNPRALRMIVWSSYFQKETNNLCARIKVNSICGIYKITNIKNNKVYIGQSKDISTRIKSHIKCGLGIDTPSTNQLYAAMQKYGIWNFTFELLEKCDVQSLNECERKWIEIFQADSLGYNATKGNK